MNNDVLENGVTSNTTKNILFGAGTIHKGLAYDSTTHKWNFAESLFGATNGGSKLDIIPEITTIPIDGVLVKAKGLDVKTGEKATMEINFAELTPEMIKASALGEEVTTDVEDFKLIKSKSKIVEGDYYENIAFVGVTLDKRPIIAILPNALCTSGFSNEGKTKEGAVGKYTFECYQDLTGDLTVLPWKIYYPDETEEAQENNTEQQNNQGEE